MPDRRCHIVINPQAGAVAAAGLTLAGLRQRFEAEGWRASAHPDGEASLVEQIEHALASDAPVVAAAGGDGTITAVAARLAGTSKALLVLPLGTANLLARDLGLPLDLDQAVAAAPEMRRQRIDVGEVNGVAFLHNVTVGFAPRLAAVRERIRGRGGLRAWLHFARYFLHRLAQPRRLAVEIRPRAGEPHVERARTITVANNDYDEGLGRLFARRRLDAGQLTLYLVRRLALPDLLRLLVRMLAGRWRDDRVLRIESVDALTIRLKRRSIVATVDGEVATLGVPLDFSIRRRALAVLAPPPEAPPPAAAVGQAAES